MIKKEVWKRFMFKKNKYKVSNLGRVYSFSKRKYIGYFLNGKNVVEFTYKNKRKKFNIDKLVIRYFKTAKNKPEAFHKNLNLLDDRSINLKPMTKSQIHIESWKRKKLTEYVKIGVYSFNSKICKKKYRVIICENKKAKLIGYYNTYNEAYTAWKNEFLKNYKCI